MYASLPFTGISAIVYGGIGLGAIVAGAVIRILGRRR